MAALAVVENLDVPEGVGGGMAGADDQNAAPGEGHPVTAGDVR
jgi:hypothetical protein